MDGDGSDRDYGPLFTDEEEEQQQQRGGEEMEAKGRNMPSGNTHTYACTQTHTCMWSYAHKQQTTRCTCECIHETYVSLQTFKEICEKAWTTKCRQPPIHTHKHWDVYRGLESEVVLMN